MIIYMVNNPYGFDVEQTAIILMPERTPRVTDSPAPKALIEGDFAVSKLNIGAKSADASFFLQLDDRYASETCRTVFKGTETKEEKKTEIRHTVRRSVYKAYVSLTGDRPAWGALAGVRPAKLARRYMETGLSPEKTKRLLERKYYIRPDKADMTVRTALWSAGLKAGLSRADAALYVGIPFCPTRCAYCSFISKAAPDAKSAEVGEYLRVLEEEIKRIGEQFCRAGVGLRAVYIGGGTPTVLNPEQLARLMSAVNGSFELKNECEYTVEAGRPDTITAEKLDAIYANGARRISINPQSFSAKVLANIGRMHTPDEIYTAYELARAAGEFKINMDLIAGLPGDSLAGFAGSVRNTAELKPENITVHTLALKKGSFFAEKGFSRIPPETISDMLAAGARLLSESGYEPYYLYRQKYSGGSFENVGYAKNGEICQYNIFMMDELLPVAGCGAGAVTKLSFDGESGIVRLTNPKYPADYTAKADEIMAKKVKIGAFYGIMNAD